jgi:hypothetical protein
MKYAVEVGSVAMIYIYHFIKIGSGIQNLMGSFSHTQIHRHRQQGDLISLIYFSKIRKGKAIPVTDHKGP